MIILDNEKDLYIKEMFKKDELISKKADDVFNNFLEGKMESEKVTNINESKDKKINRKKILSIVATLVIVFLGVNVYAITKGYDNVFFMIKDLTTKNRIEGKSEILKDQDMTISYEPIEIAKGVSVQFNRFVVKDNEATLFMKIDQDEMIEVNKKVTQVEISNGDDNSQLITKEIEDFLGSNTEEFNISFFDNNIEKLKVTINSQKECLAIMEIDLNTREILVLSNSYEEIEKISEIKLKEVLGKYAVLNFYEDMKDLIDSQYDNMPNKKEYINYDLLECAIEYISAKEKNKINIDYSLEKVNTVIKEITGMELNEPLDIIDDFYYYDEANKKYTSDPGDGGTNALCLNIKDISYEDGIYTVEYQYCYPDEDDYLKNNIDKLPLFESTIQLKLNTDYEYTEFCIVSDIYNMKSKKIKENSSNITEDSISSDINEYITLEDAAIEYRLSVNILNYKDFNYDLDGDGKIDKITIRKDKSDTIKNNYLFELNGEVFTENNYFPEIYVADLDKTDGKLEIIIFDVGPSDDLEYSIYTKNSDGMKLVETIRGNDLVLNGNGNFKIKTILTAQIGPDIYDKTYNFSNNKITSKYNNIDKSAEYSACGMIYITKNLDNRNKWYDGEVDSLEDAEIYEFKEGEKFKVKSFISDTVAVIEYNGSEYYLLSYQGNFAD